MANSWYYNSVALVPYNKAKAEDVDADFDAIEDAFDKMPAAHSNAPTTKGFSESFEIEADGTAGENYVARISQIRESVFVGTDSGSANAYVVTLSPTISAYTTGLKVSFIPDNSNTGACTVAVDGLAVKNIKSTDGGDPAANEIYAGSYVELIYDGTNFQLLNPSMSALSAPTETIPAAATPVYTALRTNSAGTAYEIGQPSNYQNRIINSEMMIDQRNEGAAVTTTGSYIVDRFRMSLGDTDQLALSGQQATGIGGLRNSIKVTATTAETDWVDTSEYVSPFQYYMLGYDVADLVNGADVTISFYFKSNQPDNSIFSVSLRAGDVGYSYVTDFTYTTSGAVQLVTKTITIPAHASNYISNTTTGIGLAILIASYAGTDYHGTTDQWNAANDMCSSSATDWTQAVAGPADGYVQISGLQFRVGSSHVPLEMKSRAEYLDECLDYYRKSYTQGTKPGTVTDVGQIKEWATRNSADNTIGVNFSRPMVGIPTVTIYSPGTGASAKVENNGDKTTNGVWDPSTNGFPSVKISSGDAGNNAGYHYTANSEI